jgi:hypothetical protein
LQKTYTTEYKAVIKAAVSGERRKPLLIFIINMSHDGEHIDADMKKGKLQLRRTSTIMNRCKHWHCTSSKHDSRNKWHSGKVELQYAAATLKRE